MALRVLVDRSAWVDCFNDQPSRESMPLSELLSSDEELCTRGIAVAEVFQERSDPRASFHKRRT